ncbi:MAG: ribonucleotide-diphosphate reductase subunit beta [Gammaproteobacteria bacterium]|nr:ribonucleotide-diphosphate reductase subunit beta [Gammaproteobacteria bacterium]
MTELITTPLFNEDGDDSPEMQKLINGCPTGISNLDENAFKWSNGLYRIMTGNFWIPEKVSMADDKVTINELTDDEDEAVRDTLSFLIFLDSYQCNNLPNLHKYITAPNVANLIIIQQYQEVIHSQSYQYMLDALYPMMTRQTIYNKWRTNPALLKRVKYVADIGQAFIDNPSEEEFKKVIAINFMLESIYFYQGFMFFDQLASRNKLIQSDKIIDYIRNDEMTHIGIFVNLINELFTEEDKNGMLRDMMRDACEQEIEWANVVYGNKILGMSEKSSEQYIHYLANDRLSLLSMEPLYPEVINPYAHLEGTKKENFFEVSAVTSYDRSESVKGWDDF